MTTTLATLSFAKRSAIHPTGAAASTPRRAAGTTNSATASVLPVHAAPNTTWATRAAVISKLIDSELADDGK